MYDFSYDFSAFKTNGVWTMAEWKQTGTNAFKRDMIRKDLSNKFSLGMAFTNYQCKAEAYGSKTLDPPKPHPKPTSVGKLSSQKNEK